MQMIKRAKSWLTGIKRHVMMRRIDMREKRNPLLDLTPDQAKDLYALYKQGQYANPMLAWVSLEEIDETLGTVMERRISALAEMDHDIIIDAKALGDSQALQSLADEQQQCLAEFFGRIENMEEAIKHLGLATFRGFSHLEVINRGNSIELSPIDQWKMVRPHRRGDWYYNEHADTTCLRGELVDPDCLIVRGGINPVDLTAMFSICAKAHAMDGCDGFIDVFGNPAIFFEYPPNTSEEMARQYDEIARAMIGDGRGSYPSGGKITTVETSARSGDIFIQRAEWANKEIVRRATGGELTVLAEAGSGTLGGNAHQETFRMLASGEGAQISSVINKALTRAVLNREFPGKKHLANWALRYEEEEDVSAKVGNIVTLAQAGYRASDETVSEIAGFDVTSANMDSTAIYASKAAGYVPTLPAMRERMGMDLKPVPVYDENGELVTNTQAGREPLSDEDRQILLAILKGQPNQAIIEQNAKAIYEGTMAQITPEGNVDPQKALPPFAKPSQSANLGKTDKPVDEEILTNGQNAPCQAKNPGECRYHGTPRESATKAKKTNPFVVPSDAPEKDQINGAQRAIERVWKKGGNVHGAIYKKGIGRISIVSGTPGLKRNDYTGGHGVTHTLRSHGNEKISPREMANIIVKGSVEPDPKNKTRSLIKYQGKQVVIEHEMKKQTGRRSQSRGRQHTAHITRK